MTNLEMFSKYAWSKCIDVMAGATKNRRYLRISTTRKVNVLRDTRGVLNIVMTEWK